MDELDRLISSYLDLLQSIGENILDIVAEMRATTEGGTDEKTS
mgnify:CR=1 FL=1